MSSGSGGEWAGQDDVRKTAALGRGREQTLRQQESQVERARAGGTWRLGV